MVTKNIRKQLRMDLHNKVAIITGSAQGLGKAFAARLLEVGVKVSASKSCIRIASEGS